MRMRYSEAIDWLREKGIKTDEDKEHEFGDDMYPTPCLSFMTNR